MMMMKRDQLSKCQRQEKNGHPEGSSLIYRLVSFVLFGAEGWSAAVSWNNIHPTSVRFTPRLDKKLPAADANIVAIMVNKSIKKSERSVVIIGAG